MSNTSLSLEKALFIDQMLILNPLRLKIRQVFGFTDLP